jgi:DNA-binding transcriptional LysR family regulator
VAIRDLPSLDLLKGFEAAARHLSFTKAGEELFLTQSAISRQVQTLEAQLGVQLFQRRIRALLLTDEGQRYFKVVREALDDLRAATASVRAGKGSAALTVSTTVSFASLWLVPRLAQFQAFHPGIQVRLIADNRIQDLERERIDVAVRYCPPGMAGAGAVRLFGVRVLPVTSPEVARAARLKRPEDLARCVLLEYDDAERTPWLTWRVWFETMRVPMPTPAGLVRFSQPDQVVQAAVAGQGVALGSVPLADELLRTGRLVAPFGSRHTAPAQSRAYYAIVAPRAVDRPAAQAFVEWVRAAATDPAGRERPTEVGDAANPPQKARRKK